MLANIMMGQEVYLLNSSSSSDLIDLFHIYEMDAFEFLMPQGKKSNDSLANLMTGKVVQCCGEVSAHQTGKILDLILGLLGRQDTSKDIDAEIPGLLVISLIVAHVSGRTTELLEGSDQDCFIVKCYAKATQ